jgi:osmotically-inducible protein OsmY
MTNLKRLSAVLAAIAMATTLGCASTSKSEGTGEYVDDTVITAKVKTAILKEPGLKSTEINVETFKGIVQLSGFVAQASDQPLAVRTAQAVAGVKSVKNDMRTK